MLRLAISSSLSFDPFWVSPRVELAPYRQAGFGRGGGDGSTTAKRLVKGVPRQFSVMWQNSRCSILLPTSTSPAGNGRLAGSVRSRRRASCSSILNSRTRDPLEPPPSAVIMIWSVSGYLSQPIRSSQRRDRVDRELRRIIVDANAHTAGVGGDVIHAIRYDLAEFGVDEVMRLYRVGTAFRPVIAAGVLVQGPIGSFFFVSIEITGLPAACIVSAAALICSNCASRSGLRTLSSVLQYHLPAVLQRPQQFGDGALAGLIPHRAQRRCQLGVALRDPPQRPHRVALGRRFQQLTQVFQQCCICLRQCWPAAARPAHFARQ